MRAGYTLALSKLESFKLFGTRFELVLSCNGPCLACRHARNLLRISLSLNRWLLAWSQLTLQEM